MAVDAPALTSTDRRRLVRWTAAASLASAVLRLRFLAAPLGADEAGAISVARAWGAGVPLYSGTFIDRPQGLLVLVQRWDAIGGAHPSSIRVLAVLAGVSVVVSVAAVAATLGRSWTAGAAAAWAAAIVTSSAVVEGYVANGELLAGGFTAPAMALAALVAVGRLRPRWLLLAGALAATGVTIKQSGFDVLAAAGGWLALAAWRRWLPRRAALGRLALLGLGSAVVLGAALVHGISLGFADYRYAVVGFRWHARSVAAGPQIRRMALTLAAATVFLAPAAVVAMRRWRADAPPRRPDQLLVVLWFATAAAGFFIGGNYHRHYWIQLGLPFAAAFGLALAAVDPAALRRSLVAALALPLAASLVLMAAPGIERDPRIDADAALAAWVREHRASPDDRLLPLCASATYDLDARQLPLLRYLWVDHVRDGAGGRGQLLALLDGPERPRYLALHHRLDRCDPSGRLAAVVARRYRPLTTVEGVEVLEAR